jgi:hypothetical protein
LSSHCFAPNFPEQFLFEPGSIFVPLSNPGSRRAVELHSPKNNEQMVVYRERQKSRHMAQ